MWSFGPHDSSHFLKNQIREILFREGLLAFLGVGEKPKEEKLVDAYCRSCKQANKNVDCGTCSRNIEVIKNAERPN